MTCVGTAGGRERFGCWDVGRRVEEQGEGTLV